MHVSETLRTLAIAALVPLMLTPLACSDPEGDLCVEKATCEQGNDVDIEVCEIQAEANEDIADEKGCIDLYDDAGGLLP